MEFVRKMGWFEKQIKQRMEKDDEAFDAAISQMAEVVMGKGAQSRLDDSLQTKDAIDAILRFYHIKSQELPSGLRDVNDQLEFLMRPSGVMRREVELTAGWYRNAIGAFLAFRLDDGSAVALISQGLSGYSFFDSKAGKRVKLTAKTEKLLDRNAICFYKAYPLKKLGFRDLAQYIVQILSPADYAVAAFASLVVALIGLITPKVNNFLFSSVVGSGSMSMLFSIAVLLAGATIATMLMNIFRSLVMARIETKMSLAVDSATMMRLFSLPASFFKEYSAGDLASRTYQVNMLCSMLTDAVLSTGLTSVFSLIYIGQIFRYAPVLVAPALVILLVTVAFTILSSMLQMKVSKNRMEIGAKESGLNYSLISGIQKIKLSGAEKRGFAKWAKLYAQSAGLTYNPPTFLKLSGVISSAISLFGMIVIYYFAIQSRVSVADYFAFNTAYGMVSGAFLSMAGVALTIANIRPVYEMVKPILDTLPEVSEGKQVLTRLSGGLELSNVSFRYSEAMSFVLENLSLKIRPGQYVAIVGKTGCGKSTLMRLLLGFETPGRGAIYYDGKDLASIDQRSLRRKIGTVMQSGKLFQGDIFSNITITAPWLTMDDAWEAAEMAGIAEDIRDMPMGMHTIISEGSGGLSGGQRQRLMIARAIAGKPKILMFDEATSALDNITQKVVSESLEKLKCTRIVIAHRLSTIRQCDRIVMLDGGHIVEDGTYDELISKGGAFVRLVELQRRDKESCTAEV